MRIHILAVGGLKAPALDGLVDHYLQRARATGRGIGLRDVRQVEVASGGGSDAEADRLVAKCPRGALCVLMDEHGESLTSTTLADWIGGLRDAGTGDLCFLIGGAAGHGAAARQAARRVLAFGAQTWPHRLVRVMLAEQVYRATSLLAGTPYHRA